MRIYVDAGKVVDMSGFGLTEVTGSVETVASSVAILTSSLSQRSGNINFKNERQRDLYDRFITGRALKTEVGESTTGSIYVNEPATVPSWTQRHVGLAHSFVIGEVSCSHHEVTALNAYVSGTEKLENTAVPMSATMYYSKKNNLVKKSYFATASLALSEIIGSGTWPPFDRELPARDIYVAVSGVYVNASYFEPVSIPIVVEDYGKIRDIKVWVEFIHDVRTTSGAIGDWGEYPHHGLQGVQLALRNPNVVFSSAYPLLGNSQLFESNVAKTFIDRTIWLDDPSANNPSSANKKLYAFPELLRSSYLLWAGHVVDLDWRFQPPWSSGSSGDSRNDSTGYYDFSEYLALASIGVLSKSFATFDRDIDMRTIFFDGSKNRNPLHRDVYFPTGPAGYVKGETSQSYIIPAVGSTGAEAPYDNPLAYGIATPYYRLRSTDDYAATWTPAFDKSALGSNIPWFYDSRLHSVGNITGSAFTASLGLSPPAGWINGAGGIANEGEFSTTGSQIGLNDIRPVFPLLDDIVDKITADDNGQSIDLINDPNSIYSKWEAFRPGLRNKEINGVWELLIGTDSRYVLESASYVPERRAGIWFRQVRLEITYDQNYETTYNVSNRNMMFKKTSYVPKKPGRHQIESILSPVRMGDEFYTSQFVDVKDEYGRTYGIIDDDANTSDFAVYSRVTGSLRDLMLVSASWALDAYITNEFGTPYIPLSLGSAVAPSFKAWSTSDVRDAREIISSVINKSIMIPRKDTLAEHISRSKILKSRKDVALKKINDLYEIGDLVKEDIRSGLSGTIY